MYSGYLSDPFSSIFSQGFSFAFLIVSIEVQKFSMLIDGLLFSFLLLSAWFYV